MKLVEREQPMATHGGVLGGDGLERPPREVGREDDVDDVLRRSAPRGRDRVDERDGPLERKLVGDAELLAQLAVERVDEALPRVDATTRQEPVLPTRLLVTAEEKAFLPAQERGYTDPRLDGHGQRPDEPKPDVPRADSGSSGVSTRSTDGKLTMTS